MDSGLKKVLRAVSLELRHTLEGTYNERGEFHPGDLEDRLNALGVWRDRPAKPLSELGHLPDEDKEARRVVDAYLAFRAEAGVGQGEAVAEFVRESAYTWANRLLCLRCMEARSIIDEVILQKEVYGWRSMVHNRLGRQDPALLAAPDEGLFVVLSREFELRARELPVLFNPKAPAIALRPSLAALKKCIGLLSGTEKAGSNGTATDAVFAAPDALGWAYQYWNAEEKDRVFEKVRTERGAKIEGADIIPATQLYTEPYMVKFLVQNSLGALWMGMHPDSNLADGWEYYVRDADRVPVEQKGVQAITFLDPACGSGHFHLEAFDLLYAMYEEEGNLSEPEVICAAILNHNLYGVDIDERAVQIAQAALWMKAKEVAWDLAPVVVTEFHHHFVATNIRLPRGKDHLETFLRKHPEDLPLRPALETVFEGLENAHELGSLLQLEEPVEKELRFLRGKQEEVQQEGFQSALFAEMGKPQQGKLPVGVESYAAWKDKVLSQLRGDFETESEAADLAHAFFGQSAGKGLALFDILARRYDVVGANPPYMGFYNMGHIVKPYIENRFEAGKGDLYAAFIIRCHEFANERGRVAMVTMNKWMTLPTYAPLRDNRTSSEDRPLAKGLLYQSTLEVLADLGSYAFSLDNKLHYGVQVAVFIFCSHVPNQETLSTFIDLRSLPDPDSKERQLRTRVLGSNRKVRWTAFRSLPKSRVMLSARPELLTLFQSSPTWDGNEFESSFAVARRGLDTCDVTRWVKFWWELPIDGIALSHKESWKPYVRHVRSSHGSKWGGKFIYAVKWKQNGRDIRAYGKAIIPNEEFYFLPGATFSRIGQVLSARVLPEYTLVSDSGSGVYSSKFSPHVIVSLLNSRIAVALLRLINPTLNFQTGDINALPTPVNIEHLSTIEPLSRACLASKERLAELDPIEFDFEHQLLRLGSLPELPAKIMLEECVYVALKGMLDDVAETSFVGPETGAGVRISPEVGPIATDLPLLKGCIDLPDSGLLTAIPEPLFQQASNVECRTLSPEEQELLKQHLQSAYAAGPGAEVEPPEVIDLEEELDDESSQITMPMETFIEELAAKVQIHPISTYWLLREGIEQEQWRCVSLEKWFTINYFTVTILRLLGHRWPRQIEAREPLPVWADKDGIIPISSGGHGEATLYDRVKECITDDFPNGNTNHIEREFADIVDEPLADWLNGSFFVRHVSQFKKRPIAWQLETKTSARGRGDPAFSCLIYYHRLDADLLPKIRSQYIRDLRRGYETEQRTLRLMSSRTADQDARLLQLDGWLDELNAFAEKLEQVSGSGFGDSPAVQAQLRQHAIDDAMQSLKAVWLRRLADVVTGGPLRDWQHRAEETGIHPELGDWIAAAMGTLHHQCASVGAKSPQAGKLKTDPDARSLAAVIGTQSVQMVKQAISLACDVWFGDLDSHVLRPALDEINELKAQVTEQEEKLNDLGAHETRARYDVEQAIKSLKARIKKLTKARNEQRKKAKELREHIEGWTYPEAAGWTEWLGTQPLFDRFASSDGQKSQPRTIADFVAQESRYDPDINDGVRVNIAPLQKAGLLAADVLAAKDVDKAIADRADWRADERRWCREGKLPRPGWWRLEG